MSQFLLVNRFREGEGPTEGTPAHEEEMRDWTLLNRALAESGDLVWSMALDEPELAVAHAGDGSGRPRRLTGREAAPDGFFALYLVEVADRDEAEQWAARMPTAAYGAVEVRAVSGPGPQ